MNLSYIDAGIVLTYLLVVFVVGIYMERRAGKNIDSYFLGGHSMPWWLLGMSGSSSYFDITIHMVPVLRAVIDKEGGVTIDDCERFSRSLGGPP